MQIVRKKNDLERILSLYRKEGKIIGFVPTMGALHKGHISLIETSKKSSDITVCSIFVNPTQFNDSNDLERYPRTPEKDIALLENSNCDLLFMPDVKEIYPEKDNRQFDFGNLDKVLDGAHRPGHFNGVAQVVSILFDAVKPDKAFFGLKDYQQVLIIKELVKQLKLKIQIIPCETTREPDGLAMSSRNTLLSASERAAASLLPKLLETAKTLKKAGRTPLEITSYIKDQLSNNQIYKLDYVSICDSDTLKEITNFSENMRFIVLIACFVGKIRLIDNLLID